MLRTSLALSIILSLYGVSGNESLSIISVPVSTSFIILSLVIPGFLNGFLYLANTDGISFEMLESLFIGFKKYGDPFIQAVKKSLTDRYRSTRGVMGKLRELNPEEGI